jgi:hypothetical protein
MFPTPSLGRGKVLFVDKGSLNNTFPLKFVNFRPGVEMANNLWMER